MRYTVMLSFTLPLYQRHKTNTFKMMFTLLPIIAKQRRMHLFDWFCCSIMLKIKTPFLPIVYFTPKKQDTVTVCFDVENSRPDDLDRIGKCLSIDTFLSYGL